MLHVPIQRGGSMNLPYKYLHQVDETRIMNLDELIESLAELGGFKVYEVKGFNDEHEGYIMELAEDNTDSFIEAELAAEAHENETVSAMGSYMEDD